MPYYKVSAKIRGERRSYLVKDPADGVDSLQNIALSYGENLPALSVEKCVCVYCGHDIDSDIVHVIAGKAHKACAMKRLGYANG